MMNGPLFVESIDYEAALDALDEWFRAEGMEPLEWIEPIIDAALRGATPAEEETQDDYVCCAKGLPSKHKAEIRTERRFVSPWRPVGDPE